MTTLAPQQEDAIRTIVPLIKGENPQPLVYLAGFAGTGKSTMLPDLLSAIGTPPERVAFMAPTGKAAKVMRNKLRAQGYANCNVSTIHSAIYRAKPAPIAALEADIFDHEDQAQRMLGENPPEDAASIRAGAVYQSLKKAIARLKADLSNAYREDKINFQLNVDSLVSTAELIVVDEASMVGSRMAEDLMYFGVPVLAMGDPGQLPPVQDEEGLTSGKPDYFLTEIHRQAAHNPILYLANLARQGKELPLGDYGDGVRVMRRFGSDGYTHDWDAPEQPQIICGTNKTRWKITRAARDGMPRSPRSGEPLIVCKNNKVHPNLVNGTPVWATSDGDMIEGNCTFPLNLRDEDGANYETMAFQGLFEETYLGAGNYTGPEGSVYRAKQSALQLDFAYAITAHKSQGSQWDDVWVVDESAVFRADANRWLYTAITRAAERLTLTV